jgi:hypothetical protein
VRRAHCLTLCLTLGALALTACAHQLEPLTITVPAPLDEACPRPDAGEVETIGDLATFSIRQEAALGICEARRAALVSLIEGHRQIVGPKGFQWPWER